MPICQLTDGPSAGERQRAESRPPNSGKVASYSWIVAEAWRHLPLPQMIEQSNEAAYLKAPSANSSSRVFTRRVGAAEFVVKRYFEPRLARRFKSFFRPSRGMQAFMWAGKLAALRIPAIISVAAASRCCSSWDSYFVSVRENGLRVHDYLEQHGGSSDRCRLLAALAKIMARLHNAGIAHRDAHLANFLVSGTGSPQPVLVDLDGLRQPRFLSAKLAANDLSRMLDYSPGTPREHLRFLAEYLRARAYPFSAREFAVHFQFTKRGPGPLRHGV